MLPLAIRQITGIAFRFMPQRYSLSPVSHQAISKPVYNNSHTPSEKGCQSRSLNARNLFHRGAVRPDSSQCTLKSKGREYLFDTGRLPHPLMYGMPIAGTDAAGFNPRRGTLTGLAIRTSNGQKVLATNIHAIAGLGPFGGTPQPLGFEEMYQEDHLPGQSRKVGELTASEYEYSPVLDIGVCDLEPEVEATYQVHDSRHDLGMVVRGTKEPGFGMKLVVAGRTGGVGTAGVLEVNDEDETLESISKRGFPNVSPSRKRGISPLPKPAGSVLR